MRWQSRTLRSYVTRHPHVRARHRHTPPRHPHARQRGCTRGSPAREHAFTRRVAARVDCDTASVVRALHRSTGADIHRHGVSVSFVIREAIHRIGLAHARHRCPHVSPWAYAAARWPGPSAQGVGASAIGARRSLSMPWLMHRHSRALRRESRGHPSGWAHASAGRVFASAGAARTCVDMDQFVARHRCPNARHIARPFRVFAYPNRRMRIFMAHHAAGHPADAVGHPEDASTRPGAQRQCSQVMPVLSRACLRSVSGRYELTAKG